MRASIKAARTQLEILCRNVPDSPGLDRLLRYKVSLERSFDRTLSQLERLQRMRLDQPACLTRGTPFAVPRMSGYE